VTVSSEARSNVGITTDSSSRSTVMADRGGGPGSRSSRPGRTTPGRAVAPRP
jgi:hypothetical protein